MKSVPHRVFKFLKDCVSIKEVHYIPSSCFSGFATVTINKSDYVH